MPWHRLCQGICFGKEGTYSLARDLLTNSGSLGEPAVFELAQYTHSTNGDLSKLWGGECAYTGTWAHARACKHTPPARAHTIKAKTKHAALTGPGVWCYQAAAAAHPEGSLGLEGLVREKGGERRRRAHVQT